VAVLLNLQVIKIETELLRIERTGHSLPQLIRGPVDYDLAVRGDKPRHDSPVTIAATGELMLLSRLSRKGGSLLFGLSPLRVATSIHE